MSDWRINVEPRSVSEPLKVEIYRGDILVAVVCPVEEVGPDDEGLARPGIQVRSDVLDFGLQVYPGVNQWSGERTRNWTGAPTIAWPVRKE